MLLIAPLMHHLITQKAFVTGGVLSVSEAAEIQDFNAYNNNSSYTIEDSAADILSYPGVVTDSGVNIVVTDTVGVADGESLSDLEGIMHSGEMATENNYQ